MTTLTKFIPTIETIKKKLKENNPKTKQTNKQNSQLLKSHGDIAHYWSLHRNPSCFNHKVKKKTFFFTKWKTNTDMAHSRVDGLCSWHLKWSWCNWVTWTHICFLKPYLKMLHNTHLAWMAFLTHSLCLYVPLCSHCILSIKNFALGYQYYWQCACLLAFKIKHIAM